MATAAKQPRALEAPDTVSSDHVTASMEHVQASKPCSSLDVIRGEYGRGVSIYFHYVKFLLLVNSAMTLFVALAWLVAAAEGLLKEEKGEESSVHNFLLSSYPQSASPIWYFSTCAQILIGFAIGPVFRKYQRILTLNWRAVDREERARNDKKQYLDEHGAVMQYSSSQRLVRRIVSATVFAIVLVVQGIGTWELHVLLAEENNNLLSLIIAASISVLNMLYKKLSKWLTEFERHSTYQSYREWDCGKVFTLKIANVLVLYIVKQATAKQSILEKSFCPLASIGTQFFWLIVSDITLNNAIEVVLPLLTYLIKKRRAARSGEGNNYTKMEFDMAEEYNELLYRQFIILLGMTVFPWITALGAAGTMLEYALDKVRLVYLCKVPAVKEEPLRPFLILCASIVVSLCALASFPNGALWILSGENMENCTFFI